MLGYRWTFSNRTVFGLYLLFFAIYLSVYVLENSLIGGGDVILHLVIFKEHWASFVHLFSNTAPGYSFFPEHGLSQFAEPYFGEALFFLIPNKIFRLNDAQSIYILMVLLHTLNAFSMFLFSKAHLQSRTAMIASGFFFAASCFMLSRAEQLNGVAFFSVLLSLKYLEDFLRDNKIRPFLVSMLFLGLQAYFSLYLFLAGGMLYALYFIFRAGKSFPKIQWLVAGAGIVIALLAPLLPGIRGILRDGVDPFMEGWVSREYFSMNLKSFLTSFQNNLVYRHIGLSAPTRANTGLILLALAIVGFMVSRKRNRIFYGMLIVLFTILSFGDFLEIGNQKITMPMAYMDGIPAFKSLFRMPYRFYIIALLGYTIMASYGLDFMLKRFPRAGKWMALGAIGLFLLENVQFPPHANSVMNQYLQNKASEKFLINIDAQQTVLYLPSEIFSQKDAHLGNYEQPFNPLVREYIYSYWKLGHHHNVINGVSSYIPHSRMRSNTLIQNISNDDGLCDLLHATGVGVIIYDHRMVLDKQESDLYTRLSASPFLEEVKLDSETSVFTVSEENGC